MCRCLLPGVGKGWTDIKDLEVKFKTLVDAYEIYFKSVGKFVKGELEVSNDLVENGKINFSCLAADCPSPCCGTYEGVDPDLVPVYEHGFSDIPVSANTKDQLEEMGEGDKIKQDSHIGMCFIELNQDKSCPFFENGLCNIYGLEPPVCAAYPFYIDPFGGLCVDRSCPGVGNGWTDVQEFEKEFLALMKEYELFFASLDIFEVNEEIFKLKDLFE